MFDAKQRKLRSRDDLVLGLCVDNASEANVDNSLKKDVENASLNSLVDGETERGRAANISLHCPTRFLGVSAKLRKCL